MGFRKGKKTLYGLEQSEIGAKFRLQQTVGEEGEKPDSDEKTDVKNAKDEGKDVSLLIEAREKLAELEGYDAPVKGGLKAVNNMVRDNAKEPTKQEQVSVLSVLLKEGKEGGEKFSYDDAKEIIDKGIAELNPEKAKELGIEVKEDGKFKQKIKETFEEIKDDPQKFIKNTDKLINTIDKAGKLLKKAGKLKGKLFGEASEIDAAAAGLASVEVKDPEAYSSDAGERAPSDKGRA